MYQNPLEIRYSCAVVDDDEIDRLTVLAFLEHYPFVKVVGNSIRITWQKP